MNKLKTIPENVTETPSFNKIGTADVLISFFRNPDPVSTRIMLAESGLRPATFEEMKLILNANRKFRDITEGKWFRIDLELENNQNQRYNNFGNANLIKPKSEENWQIFRWHSDEKGNIKYMLEPDAYGIILKTIIGIDKNFNMADIELKTTGLRRK